MIKRNASLYEAYIRTHNQGKEQQTVSNMLMVQVGTWVWDRRSMPQAIKANINLFLNIQATKKSAAFINHVHDFNFPNSAAMVRPALLPECIKHGFESYYYIRLTGKLASSRSSQRRARPSHACGAQEWRHSQRPPCYLRYVDELNFEGGGTD